MKIYKVKTNGYDMFVTVDTDDNTVRYYTTAEFVYDIDIRDVEDDSSWEDDCFGMDFDEFIGDAKIVDEADFEG